MIEKHGGSLLRIVLTMPLLVVCGASLLHFGTRQAGEAKADTSLGGPIDNLTPKETVLFTTGEIQFLKEWDPLMGFGPVFTHAGCADCHSQPVPGGGSNLRTTLFGKTNTDGTFDPLTEEGGPTLQPRSISRFQPSCVLAGEAVPADADVVATRVSYPAFGAGLINSISDDDILANAVDKGQGIHGVANMVQDQNGQTRVGRFGHKAQIPDLLQFTAEAFLNDFGVTTPLEPNENLPQGQPIPPNCSVTVEPNDNGQQLVAAFLFMEYLAPNPPGTGNANGDALFDSVGCSLCHVRTYTTLSNVTVPLDLNGTTLTSQALSNQPVNLYSDLLLHDMGPRLADGVTQGQATSQLWRTTPLWGLSQRTHYLHDGRATDLTTAITGHGGEATQVITNFKALSPSDQGDLLSFIDSL